MKETEAVKVVEEELTEVKQKRNQTLPTQKSQDFRQVSARKKKKRGTDESCPVESAEVMVTEVVSLPACLHFVLGESSLYILYCRGEKIRRYAKTVGEDLW